MTAKEIKDKIIDFEPYRVEKELEQFKDYDEKNFFADYYVSDECKNPDSYGIVCVKCGECGRTFTKDGILKESEDNDKGNDRSKT